MRVRTYTLLSQGKGWGKLQALIYIFDGGGKRCSECGDEVAYWPDEGGTVSDLKLKTCLLLGHWGRASEDLMQGKKSRGGILF